jgi:hypothetical protein
MTTDQESVKIKIRLDKRAPQLVLQLSRLDRAALFAPSTIPAQSDFLVAPLSRRDIGAGVGRRPQTPFPEDISEDTERP